MRHPAAVLSVAMVVLALAELTTGAVDTDAAHAARGKP